MAQKQIHKPWSEEELQSLKQDYGILTPKQLEMKYNRKYKDIRSGATRHGIKSKRYTGKRRFWTQDEEEKLVQFYNADKAVSEIAEMLDRSKESIKNKIKELNTKRPSWYLSNEQKQVIKKLYGTKVNGKTAAGARTLAKMLHKAQTTILHYVRTEMPEVENPSRRQYAVDERYFEKIDSHNKAYVLGLFYSDGCNNEDRGSMHITLQERDRELLQKIKYEMKSERPLGCTKLNIKGQIKKYYTLPITSRKLSTDLAKQGAIAAKSLILQPPHIHKDLFWSFLRGMSDGDGSISVYKSCAALHWELCGGAKKLLEWIKQNIEARIHGIYVSFAEYDSVYYLKVAATANVLQLFNEMYRDVWQDKSPLYMQRKFAKIQEWKELRKEYELQGIQSKYKKRAAFLAEYDGRGVLSE